MLPVVNENTRALILEAVLAERERQDQMHGEANQGNTDLKWLAILTEEVGEVAKDILENKRSGMFEEVIQCAAVCFAWAEAFQNGAIIVE